MRDYHYTDDGFLICPKCGDHESWVISFVDFRAKTADITKWQDGEPEATPVSNYGDTESSQDETWSCQNMDEERNYCEFEYRFGRYVWHEDKGPEGCCYHPECPNPKPGRK